MTFSVWVKIGAVAFAAAVFFFGGYRFAAALYQSDIDELKAADAARTRRHDAVAGHAGHLMHDRNPPSDDRVEQRRLPDVRAADDRDGRQRGAFFSFRS